MINPAFENLDVDFWVHPGKLGVTQPSLCLFHDTAKAGLQLLDALDELKDETCPARRVLTFANCSRPTPLRKLKLKVVAECEELKEMSILTEADTGTIEMTTHGLARIRDAVASWLAGAEDFGVSPRRSTRKPKQLGRLDRESGELWFWGPGYAGP